jgi:hypothetical protein
MCVINTIKPKAEQGSGSPNFLRGHTRAYSRMCYNIHDFTSYLGYMEAFTEHPSTVFCYLATFCCIILKKQVR